MERLSNHLNFISHREEDYISSRIANNVCRAVFEILGPHYVNTPRNTRKWLDIAEKFCQRKDFLCGIGVFDGKHIIIKQSFDSGSHYRNYKGTGSIILLAMIGLKYEFLYADVSVEFGVNVH